MLETTHTLRRLLKLIIIYVLSIVILVALMAPGGTSHVITASALAPQVGRDTRESPNQQVRTLWTAAEDGATVSPDGKVVAFIDWNSGYVTLRDLASNSSRTLTDKGSFGNRGFPEPFFVFSPKGDRLLYPYGNALAADPFRYELRMVGTEDLLQETVVTYPPDLAFVAPLDWHAKAGILFTTVGADSSSELLIMHPDNRSVRVLERRTASAGMIRQGFFTPSGESVVYLSDGKLHLIMLRGGAPRLLSITADALLGWSGGGRRLIFHDTRENITGNWSIEFNEDRPIGKPSLLQRTTPGVMPAGRFVEGVCYLEPASVPQLFVATLDLTGGHLVAAPEAVKSDNYNVVGNPSWSPDGLRLAFTLRVPNRTLHRVMVSEGPRGVPKEIARVDLRVMGLDWSADGKFLVIGGRADTRNSSWVGRINVTTGAIERVAWAPTNAIAAGPNEQLAYVEAAPAGQRTVKVILLPRVGTQPRILAAYTAEELPRSMSISPDGKWVAIVKSSEKRRASVLLLLPVEGGEPRTLLRLERPDSLELNLGSVPWSADGKKVLVLLRRHGQRRFAAADVDTGDLTVVPFSLERSGRSQPALHPDARQLVYVDGEIRNELKLISGSGK